MSSPSNAIQSTFAGGELSPSLHARVDLAKYSTGLKTARNVNVLAHGGVRNRPGTYHVAAAGDSTHKVRVVPFVYADGQSYIIEFGKEYIRFFTADEPVVASNTVSTWVTGTAYAQGDFVSNIAVNYYCLVAHTAGTFATDLAAGKWIAQTVYQIISPYLSAEIFDLKFTQSADYLYIFHPLQAPQQLVRLANDSWQLSPFVFKNGPFMLQNTVSNNTLTASGTATAPPYTTTHTISQVVNMNYYGINGGFHGVKLITVSAHGLKTGDLVEVTLLDGAKATELNGYIFSILYVDSTSFILCYQGTLSKVHVTDFVTYTATTGTASSQGPITLTSSVPLFTSDMVGSLFQLVETVHPQPSSKAFTTDGEYTITPIKCGHDWNIITSGTWAGIVNVQVSIDNSATWTTIQSLQSTGSDNYQTAGDTGFSQCLIRVLSSGTWSGTATVILSSRSFDWSGVVQVTAYSSATSVTGVVLEDGNDKTGLASTTATYQWSQGSWSEHNGWPSVGTFFQDRLCFGGTVTEPQRWDASQTGDYGNFGVSFPMVDSDAISAQLPSRTVNIVKNMATLGQLVVLTSDSDFSIEPGSSGALTPTSIQITCHGHRGTNAVSPAIVGNELVLVQQMGSVVRNLIYQFSVSGYMGDNISIISQHLLTGYSIVEMAYQQEPDSILWAVRSDGKLLSMTYLREQEVIAWTWHDTNNGTDLFESVACIPNSTLGINEVWFVVNRGGTRYIERMAKRDMGTDVSDYMMLDCATTQDNGSSPSASVTGISHLNGKTVKALVDGRVVTGLTVAAGATTLPVTASVVHIGLPYISDVETLRIEAPDQLGTTQGRKVSIPMVTVRFWNSVGGHLGTTSQDSPVIASTGVVGLDEIPQKEPTDLMSAAIQLKTRDYQFNPNGGYDFGTSVFYRQVDPLPFCVNAFIPKIVRGDS